jgi:hypothetical protein
MYVTRWCPDHAGIGFQFNESKSTVTYAGMVARAHVVMSGALVQEANAADVGRAQGQRWDQRPAER